jgi:hypothetical protein
MCIKVNIRAFGVMSEHISRVNHTSDIQITPSGDGGRVAPKEGLVLHWYAAPWALGGV